eukprot:Lithocolla_globosa_v1_NODE_140_length_5790_cov_49.678989.p4 type:complete len:216 gc:universal NODE_140_length_5790_cov_49.678989:2401-3048(+)
MARRVPDTRVAGHLSGKGAQLMMGSVDVKTIERYEAAATEFYYWCGDMAIRDYRDLDEAMYIAEQFDDDPSRGSRQRAIYMQAGVAFILSVPSRQLPGTSRVIQGWNRLVPGLSPPPLPWDVVMVMARESRLLGNIRFACCLVVCFLGYLRVNELRQLSHQHVGLPGDLRLLGRKDAMGLYVKGKTGPNQFAYYDSMYFEKHSLQNTCISNYVLL